MARGKPKGMPDVDHPFVCSVSQIDTADLCMRKWALGKIDHLYPPGSEAADLGDRVHDVLENYLKKGVDINTFTNEGQIALSAVIAKLLPAPKTPYMDVEKWFVLIYGVAAYRGKKDYNIRKPGHLPIVGDHKTCGTFGWAKTVEELLVHVQSGLYAYAEMEETGSDEVELEWNYMRTKGARKAQPRRITMNREQATAIMERTNETAKKMIEVLRICKTGMDVPPTPSGCAAFGGCAFRVGSKAPEEFHRCNLKPKEVMRAMMAQGKSSKWLQTLKKRRGVSDKPEDVEEQKKKDKELVAKGKSDVNPPERDTQKKPPPPAAREIEGEWVQAVWDDDAWDWKYPGDAKKEEKKTSTGKKPSKAAALLAKRKAKNKKKEPEVLDAEEPDKEEKSDTAEPDKEENQEVESEAAIITAAEVSAILDQFVALVAKSVAEILQKK